MHVNIVVSRTCIVFLIEEKIKNGRILFGTRTKANQTKTHSVIVHRRAKLCPYYFPSGQNPLYSFCRRTKTHPFILSFCGIKTECHASYFTICLFLNDYQTGRGCNWFLFLIIFGVIFLLYKITSVE